MFLLRKILFVLANLGMAITLAVCASGPEGDVVRFVFVSALFAICSLPLLFRNPLNGPYAVLAAFLGLYFVFFGLQDFIGALDGRRTGLSTGVLSDAELVILIGAALVLLFYRLAVGVTNLSNEKEVRDWEPSHVIFIAMLCCVIGSAASWYWRIHLITDTSAATMTKALSSVGQLSTTLLMIAQLMQPLGIVMLAYAQTMYRRSWLFPLLIAVVLFQVVLGFAADVKGQAMLGGMIVIITHTLVHGKFPKAWIAVAVVFIVVAFPVLQAHRVAAGMRGTNHAATAADPLKVLAQAFHVADQIKAGRHKSVGSFFQRASLKASVEVILAKTGHSVPFQAGATIEPVLTAFIPRIIWTDKPNVPTGQIMNREFHISPSPDTFISPSHIGELYWNFGWAGVLFGMPLIGFILGTVGSRCDLSKTVSITRLLIIVITLRQLVQGFEGALSSAYVPWMRSVAAIGLLHLALARVPALMAGQREERHSQDDFTGLGQTRTVAAP